MVPLGCDSCCSDPADLAALSSDSAANLEALCKECWELSAMLVCVAVWLLGFCIDPAATLAPGGMAEALVACSTADAAALMAAWGSTPWGVMGSSVARGRAQKPCSRTTLLRST